MTGIYAYWIGFLLSGAVMLLAPDTWAAEAPIGVPMGKRLAVAATAPVLNRRTGVYEAKLSLTNKTKAPLYGPFSVILTGPRRPGVSFLQADGDSTLGPYVLVHPPGEQLKARKKLQKVVLRFSNSSRRKFKPRLAVYGHLAPYQAPVEAEILPEPPASTLDDRLIPAPALAATPLLNEVRFLTADVQTAFVELKGATPAALSAGLVLRNSQGQTYPIPGNLRPKDGNGIVTVYFNGLNEVAGDLVRASPAGFLGGNAGTLSLEDPSGKVLDSVRWGLSDPAAVSPPSTGLVAPVDDVVLARRPLAVTPAMVSEWYQASPNEATPGGPNRNPGLTALFPGDNDVVQASDALLSWLPVPGALDYQLQVARDGGFTQIVLEQTVTDLPVALTLASGNYYWRVQARHANGVFSDWSMIHRLVLVEGDPAGGIVSEAATAANPGLAAAAVAGPAENRLAVPLYSQHKDTTMLLLESERKTWTAHAWDAAHPGLDADDPADNMNCAAASISMINGYFAGASSSKPRLHQDRINLQVFTQSPNELAAKYPGPEFDTGFGIGMTPNDVDFALDYALGAPAHRETISAADLNILVKSNLRSVAMQEKFWTDLRNSIDQANPKPVFIQVPRHAMVAVGWRIDARGVRWVYINNPWMLNEARKRVELKWLGSLALINYWTLPDPGALAADEADFSQPPQKGGANPDTDNDHISDYEETNRFKTKPNQTDTDADCIDDFHEIEGSVFNERHGWGTYWEPIIKARQKGAAPPSPSSDGANRPGGPAPERDGISPDRDRGGLPDTLEDFNLNAAYEPHLGETDPDNPDDDLTSLTGTLRSFRDQLDRIGDYSSHIEQDMRVELRLRFNGGGRMTGFADVTHTQTITRVIPANFDTCGKARTSVSKMIDIQYTTGAEGYFVCQDLYLRASPALPAGQNVPGQLQDPHCGSGPITIPLVSTWGGPDQIRSAKIVKHDPTEIQYVDQFLPPSPSVSFQYFDRQLTIKK